MRVSFLTLSALAAPALGAELKSLRYVGETPVLSAVHEWGTYISCQGSDGAVLAGVHHEEQALPDFVHTRGDSIDGSEDGLDWAPVAGTATEVTQKMETPVIYFYTDSAADVPVTVDVEFPDGVTSHVYPAAVSNEPAVGAVEATAGGRTTWDVTVKAAGESVAIPAVAEDSIWAPSRRVDANFVQGAGDDEADRLIFYRGVGRFDLDLHATSDAAEGVLRVANVDDDQDVPAAFALETDGYSRGRVVALGGVAAGASATAPLSADARSLAGEWLDFAEYETRASVLLEASLRDAGLFPLEARAMVDTWTRSYFQTPGVRVLYVAPRGWVDEVLPISVQPTPAALERAFVGRVEVLLAGEEQALLAAVRRGADWAPLEDRLGRFAEPWIRRLGDLAAASGDGATAERCAARATELA